MPHATALRAREAIPTKHDTERCAWWEGPCNVRVSSQDLCWRHYSKMRWSSDHTPRFSTTTPEAIRTHHALTAIDDTARIATCSLCGPGRPFHWTGNLQRRRRTCSQVAGSQQRKRKTGWSEEEYDLAVIAQGNRCAICGLSPEGRGTNGVLQADHCHASARTRQLLCGQCNHVLGLMGDDPAALRAAADYLEAHA